MRKILLYIYLILSFAYASNAFGTGATGREICESDPLNVCVDAGDDCNECISREELLRRESGNQVNLNTELESDCYAVGKRYDIMSNKCVEIVGGIKSEYKKRDAKGGANDDEEGTEKKLSSFQGCEKEAKDTENSCDAGKNSGMNSVMGMLDMMTKQLGQATSGSIELACSKLGTISQTASVAMTGYKMNCTNSILACENACDAEKNETNYFEMMRLKKKCTAMNVKVQDAGFSINSLVATNLNSKKCEQLAMNSPDYWCKKDPNSIMCTAGKPVDCSNPTLAKTNAVCICRSNPRDAVCNTLTAGQIKGGASSPNVGGGIEGGTSGKDSGNLSMGNSADGSIPFGDGTLGKPGDGGEPMGFKGGSGGMGSGGMGSGGGRNSYAQQGKNGESAINTKVIGGYGYGGGSGAGGMGSSGSGRTGSAPGGSGYYNGMQGQQKVDLKQFLPGGQFDPQRNIAGIAGPDGITGPNSDIWLKVKNRYGSIMRSLRP